MTAWMWLLVVLGGAATLGAFIFYGQRKTEEPEPVEVDMYRDAGTREAYRKAEEGQD